MRGFERLRLPTAGGVLARWVVLGDLRGPNPLQVSGGVPWDGESNQHVGIFRGVPTEPRLRDAPGRWHRCARASLAPTEKRYGRFAAFRRNEQSKIAIVIAADYVLDGRIILLVSFYIRSTSPRNFFQVSRKFF